MKIIKKFLSFISLALLCACQNFDESRYTESDAKKVFDADYIIDVRSQEEFDELHVKGAIRIPYDSISTGILRTHIDKDAKIVVYCQSAYRASVAKNTLDKMGYTNVRNIGGLEADVLPVLEKHIAQQNPAK